MNVNELKAEMIRHGDTGETLANVLGISPQTFSKKINDNGAEFNQSEIAAIKSRYDLSPEQLNNIFFASEVS